MPSQQFGDVDEMIASLPKEERVLMKRLRGLVNECIPKAAEKVYYDWGTLVYKRNRIICFLWPLPGKGVTVGFQYGKLMSNEDGALLSEGRKQVYTLPVKSMKELKEKQVKALFFEAAMIDEGFAHRSRK
jgi:hypothetical protein